MRCDAFIVNASLDGKSWFCFEGRLSILCPAPTWNVRAIYLRSPLKADCNYDEDFGRVLVMNNY